VLSGLSDVSDDSDGSGDKDLVVQLASLEAV